MSAARTSKIVAWTSSTVLPLRSEEPIYYEYAVELSDGTTRTVRIGLPVWQRSVERMLKAAINREERP